MRTWRKVRLGLAIMAALGGGAAVGRATAGDLVVTLLGTGTPNPRPNRMSMATLVQAGSETLLFDMGRGVTIRLAQKRVPFGRVTAHFITHMHSDHVVGLPDLWLTGWLATPYASRKSPMEVYGPAGTRALTENLTRAYAEDIRIRTEDEHLPAAGIAFEAHEFTAGPVFERGGVKVTAFEVNHGERIHPAFGFVVEHDGRKVVLSGDTKKDERVIAAARGADLLVHEVADIDPKMVETFPSYRDIAAHHTSPEQAGEVFASARPRLAVYSHIVFAKPGSQLDVDPPNLLTRTRTRYAGPLLVGEDLMVIRVGDPIEVTDAAGRAVEVGER